MIHVFGYAKHPSQGDNPTGFYEYSDEDYLPEKFNSFKALNESMIEWVCQLEDDGLSKIRYRMTDYEKNV